MAKIDERFIVELQNKQFVTYEGLLDLAHQMKLNSIKTEIVQFPTKENNNQCIVKAMATTEDGKHFEGYGDADNGNVNRMIAKHLIRMAETRAKARALRDLTNVGMTAIEELGDDEEDKPTNTSSDTRKPSKFNASKSRTVKRDIVDNSYASDAQINYINKLVKGKNYDNTTLVNYIKATFNKNDIKALTKKEASELINMLNELGK